MICLGLTVTMTVSLLSGCGSRENAGIRQRQPETEAFAAGGGSMETPDTGAASAAGSSSMENPDTGAASAAAEYIVEIQNIAASVAETIGSEDLTPVDCAVYCDDLLGDLAAYQEQINSLASGMSGSEEFFQSVNASINEIYTITEFVRDSNVLVNNYLIGTNNNEETSVDYYTVALNSWMEAQEECSRIAAPKAVGDVWFHFQDSMKYYYEALSAEVKAMPDDQIVDTLAMYTAISLDQRYQTLFSNYYYTMCDREISGLSHQIQVLDSLMNGDANGGQVWVNAAYAMVDNIMPNLYPSMDSVLNLTLSTDGGTQDVLLTAYIEGFTQTYEQKITVTPEEAFYMIKPSVAVEPMNLDTTRTTQFHLTVEDVDTGKIIAQETQPVTIESIYDISYYSNAFGTTEMNNILAWITAESDGILELRRRATEILGEMLGSDNAILPGYQPAWGYEAGDVNIAALQVYAIQCAASQMGVRYNNGGYSFSETQRVLMPGEMDINSLITVMSNEEWYQYLAQAQENGVVYVLDCSLQKALGIKGLDYYAQ